MLTRRMPSHSAGLTAVLASLLALAPHGLCLASSTVTVQPPSADAYVDSTNANTNYGTAADLLVCYIPPTYQYPPVHLPYYWRSFIKFDLPSEVAGKWVNSASLQVYCYLTELEWEATGHHHYATATKVDSAWTETGVTWNNRPSSGSVSGGGTYAIQTKENVWLTMDVTNIVNRWCWWGDTNYGFQVHSWEGSNPPLREWLRSREYADDTSLRPKLVITYSDGP